MAYNRENGGAAALEFARRLTGAPYIYGGEWPQDGGTDCSGLVQWAYAQIGVELPRTTEAQCTINAINDHADPLQPGDLLFVAGDPTEANPGHVMIYVGPGEVFEAEETGTRIGQFPYDTPTWEFRTRPALALPEPQPAPPLPPAKGHPTAAQVRKANLVAMANVAQAEHAEHNGWHLWYWSATHFVAQIGAKPTGITLYANTDWEHKAPAVKEEAPLVAGKLGRLPARRPDGLKTLGEYVALPVPPLVAHWGHAVVKQLVMDGNDTYGDCTIAGVAHALTVWNHEVDESIPVPSSDECVKQYFLLEGSPNGVPDPSLDNGLAEADLLKDWQTTGLFDGTKIAAYAPVQPSDLTGIKQAVAYYGACYLGVNLPESAEQQFPNPWTVVPDSPIAGGHCILATGYDSKYLYCATWGAIVSVAWDWITAYCEEAWCIIPQAFIDAGKGPLSAADLAVLQADLANV